MKQLEAKNLGIGNWIKHTPSPIGNQEFIISDIRTHNELTVNGIDIDDCEPIELTEGWLLKFGFLSNPYCDVYELGNFQIHCDKTTGRLRLWCEINDKVVDLKTVHRLQNLYFSIYEKELTINN